MAGPRIAYFVHDTSHADIWRRVQMFDEGGAQTQVLGFRRLAAPDARLADRTVDLGQTRDGNFVQRIASVVRTLTRMAPWADRVEQSDVIVARNLEMLILAEAARRRYAPHAALVYECLDIHRLMSADNLVGQALRAVERRLLARCDAVVVSSPGFTREHFAKRYGAAVPRVILVENKVFMAPTEPPRRVQSAPPGPPWRIGWFGVARCARSFDILSELAAHNPGLIEIVAAGRAAPSIFGEGGARLKGVPSVTYHGPFKDEIQLAELFASVHFAWAIDYYEAGGNSDWLLANRTYRALLYGSVPIALSHVETARWLKERGVGVAVEEPTWKSVETLLRDMTPETLEAMKAAIARVPTADLAMDDAACRALVAELAGLRPKAAKAA